MLHMTHTIYVIKVKPKKNYKTAVKYGNEKKKNICGLSNKNKRDGGNALANIPAGSVHCTCL